MRSTDERFDKLARALRAMDGRKEKKPEWTGGRFSFSTKPYGDEAGRLYLKRDFAFEPGLTILVGTNGSGKSTLLSLMQRDLEGRNVPTHAFTIEDSDPLGASIFKGDYGFASAMMGSSEGEGVTLRCAKRAAEIARWLDSEKDAKERWVLLDAWDSGLSIDSAAFVASVMEKIASRGTPENPVYVVASANQYETARKRRCLDVRKARETSFDGYESYREFVIESAKAKERRLEEVDRAMARTRKKEEERAAREAERAKAREEARERSGKGRGRAKRFAERADWNSLDAFVEKRRPRSGRGGGE